MYVKGLNCNRAISCDVPGSCTESFVRNVTQVTPDCTADIFFSTTRLVRTLYVISLSSKVILINPGHASFKVRGVVGHTTSYYVIPKAG